MLVCFLWTQPKQSATMTSPSCWYILEKSLSGSYLVSSGWNLMFSSRYLRRREIG
jgi:hypothetical protein